MLVDKLPQGLRMQRRNRDIPRERETQRVYTSYYFPFVHFVSEKVSMLRDY